MAEIDRPLFVGGRNACREVLEDQQVTVNLVYLQDGIRSAFANEIRKLAAFRKVPVRVVPPARMERLEPGLVHQGIIVELSPVVYRDADEMLREIAATRDDVTEKKPVLVILDHIHDPHNFGAILRSAAAAGVSGIFVPDRGMAPVSATTIKASAGTALRLPIARVKNLSDLLAMLKERGYWVAGLDGSGDQSVWEMDWDRPVAIVVGNEGSGLGVRVRNSCDYLISIPMRGDVESLNASVAAGIVLFSAVRHRAVM